MTQDQIDKIKPLLEKNVKHSFNKLFLAVEQVEGMTGALLWYSTLTDHKLVQIDPSSEMQNTINNIWLDDKRNGTIKLWSGFHLFIDGDKEEVKYFYHDPYKGSYLDQAEKWKAEYFPGMEFEPDDDEDNWWD